MDIIPDQQPYIQEIPADWYNNKIAGLAMLRLDVIDKDISGNKWYKLKNNITTCVHQEKNTILTFGGGYSNHLSATAAMANKCQLNSIGVVRGKYKKLTPTLEYCKRMGMQLHFVSFEDYKLKDDIDFLTELSKIYNNPYLIPEGGANKEGRIGTERIADIIPNEYSHIVLSVGTGTTLIGIVNNSHIPVLGYAPMKGGKYLNDEVKQYIKPERQTSYLIEDKWNFGGFGKCNELLVEFMNDFYRSTNIPVDRVYTAKMMYGIKEQIFGGFFDSNAKLLCIHTGGLQGNLSIQNQLIY